jgi:hypothetical protein
MFPIKYIYIVIFLISSLLLIGLFRPGFYADVMSYESNNEDYVNPQVNVSYRISNTKNKNVIDAITHFASNSEFNLKSSTFTNENTKLWTEKGMLKALWQKEGSYIDVNNLLDISCYNLRVYTASDQESSAIAHAIELKLRKLDSTLKRYNNLQCR